MPIFLNALLLFLCLISIFLKSPEKKFSAILIITLSSIFILDLELLYLILDLNIIRLKNVMFSEGVIASFWVILAYYLNQVIGNLEDVNKKDSLLSIVLTIFLVLLTISLAFINFLNPIAVIDNRDIYLLSTNIAGNMQSYFQSILILISMFVMVWRIEILWRNVSNHIRLQLKFMFMGFMLISTLFIWAFSYRLTYGMFHVRNFTLMAAVIPIALIGIIYAILRHRLLNRKIFISRKMVYNSISLFIFGIYFVGLGLSAALMRYFNISIPYAATWSLIVIGIVFFFIILGNRSIKDRIRYFISTHFYINKYEYREEWLKFTKMLHGVTTVSEIIKCLRSVILNSMYTDEFSVWLRNVDNKFMPIKEHSSIDVNTSFDASDSIIRYLKRHKYLDLYEPKQSRDKDWLGVDSAHGRSLQEHGIALVIPLVGGDTLLGMVGVGTEFSGHSYGKDDYDLLFALCSQAASILYSIMIAEELSETRELGTFHKLSAFILHDIKNAASMLSLIRQNADGRMDNTEFQRDFLETIDNALRRMDKVSTRLSNISEAFIPDWQTVCLDYIIRENLKRLSPRLPGLNIETDIEEDINIRSDPAMLGSILENLLVNAYEASNGIGYVQIRVYSDKENICLEIEDNGSGFSREYMDKYLFKPFSTTKNKGMGIGLWQVKHIVAVLNGRIEVKSQEGKGTLFKIFFANQEEN
ncbi:MAG: XrtA/PEP-CTERM system histidine kinase PrsK [Nitrospirota bacterium]